VESVGAREIRRGEERKRGTQAMSAGSRKNTHGVVLITDDSILIEASLARVCVCMQLIYELLSSDTLQEYFFIPPLPLPPPPQVHPTSSSVVVVLLFTI
jgi:hypothetical protein